jgi:hypothetical protein
MGMDVFGKEPRTEKGAYFRNNVWAWHPLWSYCEEIAPDIAGRVECGHSNDGDGLDAADAEELAQRLQAEVDSGATARYATERQAALEALPDEECSICSGTGKRRKPPQTGPGRTPCNGCDGTGKVRPFATHYPFDVENVQEFVEFLRDCGGFAIC